jgi:hypothetical protein
VRSPHQSLSKGGIHRYSGIVWGCNLEKRVYVRTPERGLVQRPSGREQRGDITSDQLLRTIVINVIRLQIGDRDHNDLFQSKIDVLLQGNTWRT